MQMRPRFSDAGIMAAYGRVTQSYEHTYNVEVMGAMGSVEGDLGRSNDVQGIRR
jgi:hypothetical protein